MEATLIEIGVYEYLHMEIVLQDRLRDKCISIYTWKSCCWLGCGINISVFTHRNPVAD